MKRKSSYVIFPLTFSLYLNECAYVYNCLQIKINIHTEIDIHLGKLITNRSKVNPVLDLFFVYFVLRKCVDELEANIVFINWEKVSTWTSAVMSFVHSFYSFSFVLWT